MIEFRKKHLIIALGAFIVSVLAIGLELGFGLSGKNNSLLENVKEVSLNVSKNSTLGEFSIAAISTDSADCAPVGL